MKKEYAIETLKLPGSVLEMKGELSWETFAPFEAEAIKVLTQNLEIDGFRKGAVPEAVAKKHIGEEMILTEMVEHAMKVHYPKILAEQEYDFIGRPELSITKLARGNELGFTIRVAVLPEIKLPDYKKIAKQVETTNTEEVTEKDIDDVIENLRQMRAYGHVHGPEDEHKHDEPLPEVNDEFAKSFGGFETVAAMREKIKENLVHEKMQDAKDKRRIAIMDSILKDAEVEVPAIVLESEQQKMLAQIEADIARSGLTLEAYLKQTEKTKEDLLKEFAPEALRRAKFQLMISAIAKDAKIKTTDEEVEAEADRIIKTYPGADKERAMAYADMVLTNEKVLSMLETQ